MRDEEKIERNYQANKDEIDASFERMTEDLDRQNPLIGGFTAGLELSNIVYLLTDASLQDDSDPGLL